MIDKIGGTKFVFAMVALTFAFILTVLKIMDSVAFVTFVGIIGGTFNVSNVVNQISSDNAKKTIAEIQA